jgi:hypothetical protein
MPENAHVGLTALEGEREKLLAEYDIAIRQAKDDPVKVEHGNVGEAAFRAFLQEFLPKKFGVTKGYIITPELDYAGTLEEWDIIIYDALEAPVLFVRRTEDEKHSAGKRGIPVEFVRGVVEVKATLNPKSTSLVSEKLLKLRSFFRAARWKTGNKSTRNVLPNAFRSYAVFFDTLVNTSANFNEAIGGLAPLWIEGPCEFQGGLIIRGQSHPDYSASVHYVFSNLDIHPKKILRGSCEFSEPFQSTLANLRLFTVCGGFGKNEFWKFMIDMIHTLNDPSDNYQSPKDLTGGYGIRADETKNLKLFPD